MIMRQKVGIVKRLSHNYEKKCNVNIGLIIINSLFQLFVMFFLTFYFFVIVFVNYFCQFRLILIILTFLS